MADDREQAERILDQLSLDITLGRKIDLEKVAEPLRAALKSDCAGEKFADTLLASLKDLQLDPSAAAKAALLAAVEALSCHLSGIALQPAASTTAEQVNAATRALILYDTTHTRDILDGFFSEGIAHLSSIEANLLQLESRPSDQEALKLVFGAMHSLKGIMGFLDVKPAHSLAHHAEAVLEHARARRSGIRPEECDAILRTVDCIREIQGAILSHSRDLSQPHPPMPAAVDSLSAELQALTRHAPGDVAGESSAPLQPSSERRAGNSDGLTFAPDTPSGTRVLHHSAIVRVNVEKLDSLLDAIGELVVTQTQVQKDPALSGIDSPRLLRNLAQMNKITRDLQSIAMALRMYPLRETFGRMSRIARDLAYKQQKELEVVLAGEDIELDKNVIEALVDPLTHLVRNAVDHGIDLPAERHAAGKNPRARLRLSAEHQGGNVVVEISDDGRGLDTERILRKAREKGIISPDEQPPEERIRDLIFEPGFSTAERVTDISGRGIGLDVVVRNARSIGGRVSVASVRGRSTTFRLTLPLTLAIIDGLVVRVGAERYIVPITSVVESLRPNRRNVSTVHERGELIRVRDRHLPLVRLSEFTGVSSQIADPWNAIVMIVECGTERCGLMVDELIGQQQIVIKNLGERFSGLKGISGGAILSDGRVGLILDVSEVLACSRQSGLKAAS